MIGKYKSTQTGGTYHVYMDPKNILTCVKILPESDINKPFGISESQIKQYLRVGSWTKIQEDGQ
jgi:hypothetical protein